MSLTDAQWRDIESSAEYIDGRRYVALPKLWEIVQRARRTNDQNALLWALYEDALRLGGETLGGWTREEIHEYMLGEWFGWDVHEALGMKRKRPRRRSSRLTKAEFSDFVDFVVRRFADHGIVLRLPGEVVGS